MQTNNETNKIEDNVFIERMLEYNPKAQYPTGMEDAIVGICDNSFEGHPHRFVVSFSKGIEILKEQQFEDYDDPYEAAVEWWYYNVAGSWVGVNGPIYVYDEE